MEGNLIQGGLVAAPRNGCKDSRTSCLAQENEKDFILKKELNRQSGNLGSNDLHQYTTSDSESTSSSGSNSEKLGLFGSDFIRLHKENELHGIVEQRFLLDFARFGVNTQVVAIHKNACSSLTWQTKFKSFQIFHKAHEELGNGNANLKHGWFSASKHEIDTILSQGFVQTTGHGVYARGIYLSSLEFPLDWPLKLIGFAGVYSLQSSVVDEDGMRHLVLFRVIMGRMERIHPGSEQCYPSSEEYDSGVDDVLCPKKYIVWSCHMNTHIFPDFVISIKTPSNPIRDRMASTPSKKPNSPWMSFPALIDALSKFLAKDSIRLIRMHHAALNEKKITRDELIKRFRVIAGDKLLIAVIKAYRDKGPKKVILGPREYQSSS